jgi:hypothetical protein
MASADILLDSDALRANIDRDARPVVMVFR